MPSPNTREAAGVSESNASVLADRNRLELLLHQLPVAVVLLDHPAGTVVSLNREAEELLGGSLPPDWTPPAPDAAGGSAAAQLELERGGRRRLLEIRASAIRGFEGTTVAIALIVEDVSERERRKRAEREFVSNAAHQLRTPLAAITSAIDVLQGGAKDEPDVRDRFLGYIESASGRLSRLAHSLLVLARAQATDETPRQEIVPVAPLLEEVVARAHPGERVRVDVSCAPDLAALANRPLLQEAIESLVENAVRYTSEGSIAVTAARDGASVRLEVQDTGPGITPERQEHVFDRFYSAPAGAGFGLGLAIAQQAAAAAGATLELESAPGRGTTARISLPAARLVTGGTP